MPSKVYTNAKEMVKAMRKQKSKKKNQVFILDERKNAV
jgi:hypothetical protein